MQIKLATICNKNKQEQDAKNNAGFQTKLTKMTWKAFKRLFRRGRNRSIKASLVTHDDDDDDIVAVNGRHGEEISVSNCISHYKTKLILSKYNN